VLDTGRVEGRVAGGGAKGHDGHFADVELVNRVVAIADEPLPRGRELGFFAGDFRLRGIPGEMFYATNLPPPAGFCQGKYGADNAASERA